MAPNVGMNTFLNGLVGGSAKTKESNMAKAKDQGHAVPAEHQAEQVKVEVNKGQDIPKQSDIVEGVPNQEPPTKGVTARIDMDPNEVADPK